MPHCTRRRPVLRRGAEQSLPLTGADGRRKLSHSRCQPTPHKHAIRLPVGALVRHQATSRRLSQVICYAAVGRQRTVCRRNSETSPDAASTGIQ